VTGTWVAADRSFTWILAQSGSTVTGTHIPANGEPAVAINGTLSDGQFSFRVVTGEQVLTFLLDTPQVVEVGWSARVAVNGDHMTGSISPIWTPYRYWFRDITVRRIDTSA